MEEKIFNKIGEFQYSSEAFIYKAKLESEGVSVFVRDNHTIDSDPFLSNAIGGVKLFVEAENYNKAMTILSEISKFSIDDEGKLIICPNCGSKKAQLLTTVKDFKSMVSFLFSFLIVALPIYNSYKYKCESCNFEF